jgi:adenine-specific DNA-methyltransferase
VAHALHKHTLTLELQNFLMSTEFVPPDVQEKVSHWQQWIDYWAVDWDFKDDTFHNQWQAYRTKKEPKLSLCASHPYEQPGTYTVVVKVIDILGNDTTKALTVTVK